MLAAGILSVHDNSRAYFGTLVSTSQKVPEIRSDDVDRERSGSVLDDHRREAHDIRVQNDFFVISIFRRYRHIRTARGMLSEKLEKVHGPLWKHRACVIAESLIGHQNNAGTLDGGTGLHRQVLQ